MLSACFFLPVASSGRQLSATTTFAWKKNIWGIIIIGPSCDKTCFGGVCEQQRRRTACAFTQSDQRLSYSPIEEYHIDTGYDQNFNPLAGL